MKKRICILYTGGTCKLQKLSNDKDSNGENVA